MTDSAIVRNPYLPYLLGLFPLLWCSCQQDNTIPLDAEVASLVASLERELQPVPDDPLYWGDDDLGFLNPVANKSVVALGESTHGTAEFFNAKRRIFRYLVENHGYKVFAFEADFGESLFLEEAIQKGSKSEIPQLMSERMHFWTWRTREVRDLLQWMSEYNEGKATKDKVHYMGIDCQYNTYHPELLSQYLHTINIPFSAFAKDVLKEVKNASEARFVDYSANEFTAYLGRVDALQDSILAQQQALVAATSEKEFALHLRMLRVARQVSEVRFHNTIEDYSVNYRDKYMAENTAWLLDYFEGEKVVLWAHNAHIADDPNYGSGSIGYHLSQQLPNEYTTVGFMFSQGEFTARGFEDGQNTLLAQHTISEAPQKESLTEVLHNTRSSAFTVWVKDLQTHTEWEDFFRQGTRYLSIGAVFSGEPRNYYRSFQPTLYDRIIYFDVTTASQPLR